MPIRACVILLAVLAAACQSIAPPTPSTAPTAAPWPALRTPLPPAPDIETAVNDLLGKMTLEEKVGQVLQPSITAITPAEAKTFHIGSVLNGGGGWPGDVRKAAPKDWLALADAFHTASMDASDGKQAIPIIWGSDAVHGHSNIVGATLFPHNIGLGATRNFELIKRIGEVTAVEMAVTGIDWDFSPVVAVTRDDRWGRTYESYSEDPEIMRAAATKMVEGLQGMPGTTGFLGRGRVVATAKHFIGDGGTVGGKDQGDVVASEEQLRDIHGAGYAEALKAGVQSVMISQSSWQGREMHGNHYLLTEVLKGRMGFDGILVGDWNGHGQVPGCTNKDCPAAINAGLDLFMVPDDWRDLYVNLLEQARSGEIPMARLDDAVRRILRVKMRAGLFTAGKPSQRPHGGKFELLGSPAHRAVARQAVRESLVLLKNHGVLPIEPRRNVLVAGDGANSIPKQTGGWTLSWQGDGNSNTDFPGATSIWDGIRTTVEAAGGRATLSADGSFTTKPDVAIVVFGENPYAEWFGDRRHLVYENTNDLALIRRLKDAGVPVVSIFLSGRPLWVNPYINASDAFVAAWLPGTEGGGIADVVFSAPDGSVRHDFRGKLSFSWPKLATQTVLNRGDANYDPLFPFGFGLTYGDKTTLPELPVDTTAVFRPPQFFMAGPVAPWTFHADRGIAQRDEAGGRRVLTWPGMELAEVRLHGPQTVDVSAGDLALAVEMLVEVPPGRPVALSMNNGSVDITDWLRDVPLNEWQTLRVPVRCFADGGADLTRIDMPFRVSTDGPMTIRIADIELVQSVPAAACPPVTEVARPLGVGFRWSQYGPDYDPGPEYWARVGLDMARRFEGSVPETIWIVSKINGRGTLLNFPATVRDPLIATSPNDGNEEILDLFDRLGLRVWLQVEPGFASVDELIDLVMSRYKHHPSVIGFGIDVEWYKSIDPDEGEPVSDAQARSWVKAVQAHGSQYQLFLKHFAIEKMPPGERDGLVFVDDSQIFPSLAAMVAEFDRWGHTFSPAPVAFQYGYPSDRAWWSRLQDPARDIGEAILERVPNTQGLYWVDFTALANFPPARFDPRVVFDDFSYERTDDLAANGWTMRTAAGWPGVPGAKWGKERFSLHDDPAQPGNRVLRMTSSTDGTPANTRQSQICHARKYLEGTYAARVRFTDAPVSGPNGDKTVQTFYLISPLKAPMDIDYSETDFEYLPNGGWGHTGPTLFATTWETFHPEPQWKQDSVSGTRSGSLDGWHTLVLQLGAGRRAIYYVDGQPFAEHGGRYFPEVPMSMNFNLWFIRDGLIPGNAMRTWIEDIDWVFHRARAILTPDEVNAAVDEMRRRNVKFTDNVPPADPPLPSPCDL